MTEAGFELKGAACVVVGAFLFLRCVRGTHV